MIRSTLRIAGFLVGAYLGLWLVLSLIHCTRGISDQDATFIVALAAFWLSQPSASLLKMLGLEGSEIAMVIVGCLQWGLVSTGIAAMHQAVAEKAENSGGKSSAGGDAPGG